MELKDFIAKVILDIGQGIKEAQEQGRAIGFVLAPPLAKDETLANMTGSTIKPQTVHFELQIEVVETGAAGHEGGSFTVAVAQASFSKTSGKKSETFKQSATMQKIIFDLPVLWPTVFKQEEPSIRSGNYSEPFRMEDLS